MLGNDDIGVLIDEPVTAADLFGEDEDEAQAIPPLSPNADLGEDAAGADAAGAAAGDSAEGPPKKVIRRINRLPNLNEKWITDPNKEGMYAVNKYFEDIKLKRGKGNELPTLKSILRRYEYWAQQCYPKFCFTDVVNKCEYLSGKKLIKNALMDIRNKTSPPLDADINSDNDNSEVPTDSGVQDNLFPIISTPITSDHLPSQTFNSFSSPQPVTSSSSTMGDDVKEMIRRKKEEAIARRKRKLEESLNSSSISISQSDHVNDETTNGEGSEHEVSLNLSSNSLLRYDNTEEKTHGQESELKTSRKLPQSDEVEEKTDNIESELNSSASILLPRSDVDEKTDNIESELNSSASILLPQSDVEEKTDNIESELNSSASILLPQSDEVEEKTDNIESELNSSSSILLPQSDVEEKTNNIESELNSSSSILLPQSDVEEKTNSQGKNGIPADIIQCNKETEMDTDVQPSLDSSIS